MTAPDLRLSLRFAVRELRGGLRGFGIFLACIALGVATIAGVGSVARGMTDGIAREGRAILGGDMSFTLAQRQANPAERTYVDKLGAISEVATLRAMARKPDDSDQALVEVKAVDAAYPLYGDVVVVGGGNAADLVAEQGRVDGALAEPELLTRLDLKAGDTIALGSTTVAIRGVIEAEPDRIAAGFSLGPRLLITQGALQRTKIVQPGSLVSWRYLVRLAGNPTDADIAKIKEAATALPGTAWQVRTRDDAAPGLKNNVERFAEFLTLVGLTALIVGGVGVANAVASFLDDKCAVIATLKCLGAPSGLAVSVYLAEILLIAALGIGVGLVIGIAIPYAAQAALQDVIPVAVAGFYPGELALAALYGVLTVLAFSLPALGRAREVTPAALFRDQVAPAKATARLGYRIAVAVAVLALAGLSIGLAFDRRIAIIFAIGAAGAFLLLRAVASLIMTLAKRAPRPRSIVVRLALANIHRPGALTHSVVLSLGLGLTLLVTLVLVDGNFRRELFGAIPVNAPSFFFLDIQGADTARFAELVAEQAPGAKLEMQPMLRGRIVSLGGVAASKAPVDDDMRWVLEGDRGITYAEMPPPADKLTAGKWWAKDYDGPALVSFDERVAKGLHLKPGDSIAVNVLGREVKAQVANLRTIEWRSLSMNSIMIFSPNAFRGAPFSSLATVAWPDGGTPERESALLKAVTSAFPGATAIRVKEAVAKVNDLVTEIGWAVRGASGIALLASVLVLGGAFAAGRRRRIHDAVILKTLGATRMRLATAFALEFSALGLATAIFALIAGTAAAWLVSEQIMEVDFAFLAGPAIATVIVAVLTTLALGLAGTWRVLGQKAAPILRNL